MGRMGILVLGVALGIGGVACKTDRQLSDVVVGGGGADDGDGDSDNGGVAGTGGKAGALPPGEGGKPMSTGGQAGMSMGGEPDNTSMAGEPGMTTPDPMKPDGKSPCKADEYDDGSKCQALTVCGADEFEQSPPKPDQDRVCSKATQCQDDEYEKSPPSAEKDRVCSPLTVCAAGSSVSTQPTETADRACTPCAAGSFSNALNSTACKAFTACKAGESQSVAPSPTSDRVCSSCGAGKYESGGSCLALTVCSTSQYESTPATAVSDRKCTALTSCQAGSKQTAAPTSTTDRQCASCSSGTFSTTVNAADCAVWTKCGVTQFESSAPTAQKDRVCTGLTTCVAGTHIKTAATATSDRVCEACTGQTFTAADNVGDCSDWSNCSPGFSATAGTASKDRTCTACASGKFSTTQNAASCKAWTVCTASQNQTMAGTATSDVVCVDKPVCSTAPDRACTTQCPCASTEGVCTASNQCATGTTCVTGSGKKVGRAGDTCLANHCNNDTKDSTETSIDCGGECGCRATFETFNVKGLPADRNAFYASAMSRDGKRIAGTLMKGRLSYPGTMAMDGTVTALAGGAEGNVRAMSSDGSVILGQLICANPPTCSDTTVTTMTWTGTATPVATGTFGNPRDISGSGSIVVGDDYNSTTSSYYGFYKPAGKNTTAIDAINLVVGMTPDGRYVVGNSIASPPGAPALWASQTGNITTISKSGWSSISADAINGSGSDPVVVGDAYISATDSRVGFRWKGGVITELATLSTGNFIHPHTVTTDGGTITGTAGPASEAFIWTDAAKLRTIVDELRSRGLEFAIDFTIDANSFIAASDDGKIIVGSAVENTFWRAVLQ